jgi:hypothetical protein
MDADASDLDFPLPSWGDDGLGLPEPEPEPEPPVALSVRGAAMTPNGGRSASTASLSAAATSLQLAATSSRQETVADMRARLRRMEARARLRTSLSPTATSSPTGPLDESRITAVEGSPLHSLQRRAQLGGFDGRRVGADGAAGSPVIGERLLGGVGLAAPAGRAEPTAGAGMAVERAREERRGRRRWLSDRLWHTASTTSAAALMGLDSATEAALLRLRAAAAGGDLDAMQHAVDEADAVVAESYDRPHSVTEDGALGGGDGAQGLAELTACLHDVKERLATANLQQAMLLQSEETEAIVAGTPEGAPCCARPPRPAFPALLVIIQAADRCVAALELTRMRVCARAQCCGISHRTRQRLAAVMVLQRAPWKRVSRHSAGTVVNMRSRRRRRSRRSRHRAPQQGQSALSAEAAEAMRFNPYLHCMIALAVAAGRLSGGASLLYPGSSRTYYLVLLSSRLLAPFFVYTQLDSFI